MFTQSVPEWKFKWKWNEMKMKIQMKIHVHKICTWMFIEILLVIASNWKQSKYPFIEEWWNKLFSFICTRLLYTLFCNMILSSPSSSPNHNLSNQSPIIDGPIFCCHNNIVQWITLYIYVTLKVWTYGYRINSQKWNCWIKRICNSIFNNFNKWLGLSI